MARVIIDRLYKTYQSTSSSVQSTIPQKDKTIGDKSPNQVTENIKGENTRDNAVLKGIDLEIVDGEFMVLVGPSGCGKSTLLRLIAGLEDITAGNVTINDRIVNKLPPKARDIAMVFQNYALYPHLTVYDNIAFGLRRMDQNQKIISSSLMDKVLTSITSFLPSSWRYLSEREKQIQGQVQEVAHMLQIDHLLKRLPKELSGGQKQRVALGRAIARKPQAFLMDEPLSNLDAKLRTQTRMQIVKLQKQLKTTTIYVTHDQTEAMTMGDRIAVMYGGEIQQLATPLEVYHQPVNKFVAQFIGSPPMNMLLVDWQKPNIIKHTCFELKLPFAWQSILANYNYEKIWLGIRPEHFCLAGDNTPDSISAIVNLVEALGNETILTVNFVEQPQEDFQVKVIGKQRIKVGDKVHLTIDLDAVSLFDFYQEKNVIMSSELGLRSEELTST